MKFSELFEIEKKYLGGGWFDPAMFHDGRLNPDPGTVKLYKDSSRTMYDIDEIASVRISTSVAGKQFWNIINNADNKSWPWNYKGGSLAPQLSELAAQMMFPEYKILSNSYLTKGLADIVNTDAALTFNFLYATFNGCGFFKYFAAALNVYVNTQKITDPKILMDKMIEERENLIPEIFGENARALLKQGAETIKSIRNQLIGTVEFDINI
jgi:hypothetical protein